MDKRLLEIRKGITGNNSSLGVVSAISKYFDVEPKYDVDEETYNYLVERQPRNVVLMILDGLGSYNLDLALKEGDFLYDFKVKDLKTVFPPTTVAATGMLHTAKLPADTNNLGWYSYSEKDQSKILTFGRCLPDRTPANLTDKEREELALDLLTERISKVENCVGHEVSSFGDIHIDTFEEECKKIAELCTNNLDKKQYLYCYWNEPDKLMHALGVDNKFIYENIRHLQKMIVDNLLEVHNTVLLILADHGHINNEPILITDFKDVSDLVDLKKSAIDQRCISFFVKNSEDKKLFFERFNHYFSKEFMLITKNEAMESQIFGEIKKGSIAERSLGDFVAISLTNKTLALSESDLEFKGIHSGFTKEEFHVPLILFSSIEWNFIVDRL